MIAGFIPEYLIFQLVGDRRVTDHNTFIILRALIHELAEHLKGGKHTCVVFVDTFAVSNDVLTQNEDKVYVRA